MLRMYMFSIVWESLKSLENAALPGGLWQGIRIDSNNEDPLPQAAREGMWQGIRII